MICASAVTLELAVRLRGNGRQQRGHLAGDVVMRMLGRVGHDAQANGGRRNRGGG